MDTPLLTLDEVAAKSGKCYQTIWRATATGMLPSFRSGRRLYVSVEAFRVWKKHKMLVTPIVPGAPLKYRPRKVVKAQAEAPR